MKKLFIVDNLNYQSFQNIHLSFEKGKFYSIIGPNKSGKTTMFKIMSGLIKTNNYIVCDNIRLNSKTRYDFIKKIGVVRKISFNSFKYIYVYNEMAYPLYNLNYDKKVIETRISTVTRQFGMSDIVNKKIIELNEFQKQILLLMISLLHEPKVLLIDDAFADFNDEETEKIILILKKMSSKGLCVIYFSHLLSTCLESDEVILFNNYRVIKKMMVEDIMNNDKLFYDNNIELPFMIDLNIKLKMYNIIHNKYDNIKKMVDDIWQ